MDAIRKHDSKFKALLAMALAAIAVIATMAALPHQAHADSLRITSYTALAESHTTKTIDGVTYTIYYRGNQATSVFITKYAGNATTWQIPNSLSFDGKTISLKGSHIFIEPRAFKGNSSIQNLILSSDVKTIGSEAFANCTGLKTVVIEGSTGKTVSYEGLEFGQNAFAGCSNVSQYYLGKNMKSDTVSGLANSSIGKTAATGTAYPNVTITEVQGSVVETYVNAINATSGNKIAKQYDADPYKTGVAAATVETPYSPGATESAVNAAIIKYSKESDPTGSVYSILGAKIINVKKNSLTLQWSKASGAKKYIIYGNKCGTKNKMVKLATVKKAKNTFKKVNKKAVKKGTYYKFIVVALNSNGKVISTSKMVHAATSGGKVGNDKSVTTAAKKGKVSVKVGKTFKLKAKATPASKKLTVKRHRGVAYESSNKAVATVTSKGVVKGIKKGTCKVYAYAQNGVCTKVTVTVK